MFYLVWQRLTDEETAGCMCGSKGGGTRGPDPPPPEKSQQVAQWATIAHLGASIMFGDTIIDDAQRQVTLNLKQ